MELIRNIGFIAHIDAGKTTVTENVLFLTGMTHKFGSVDEGTATMDWMPQERERGITITAAATASYWKDHQINIIDTPGHVDFTAEVERSLRILDGGVVIIDAVAGVQSQSETVWRQANKYNVPRIAFVNKMERMGANYLRAIKSMQQRLQANVVPIQLPIGQEDSFRGLVDLVEKTAIIFTKDKDSTDQEEAPIPSDMIDQVNEYRSYLIEKVAEIDDVLLEKFLDNQEVSNEDLKSAIRRGTLGNLIVPVLCGAALKKLGILSLLDSIVDYLPSPADKPAVDGKHPDTEEPETRESRVDEPFCALAFKVALDPYVGRLIYIRVYSGEMKAGSMVYNATRGSRERMGRLVKMHSNHREEIEEISTGQIGAVLGLKNTFTGETICDESFPIVLEPPQFPQPVISVSVEPKLRSDQEKLEEGLRKLAEEDPTFQVKYDREIGQTVISGMGELHLEVLVDRMKRELGLDVQVGRPRVALRETIKQMAKVEGRFVRQTGGHGQYGHVEIEMEPGPRGSGFTWENKIKGGAIPQEFIRPVRAGVEEALSNGILGAFPVVDVKVTLVDGTYHPVDSSEIAFRIAGSIAAKEAQRKGIPVLLEPFIQVEVVTPSEYLSDVLGDLGGRRSRVESIEGVDDSQVIRTKTPLSELFGYATRLRSLTQGRASFSMEFDHYEEVPQAIAQPMLVGA